MSHITETPSTHQVPISDHWRIGDVFCDYLVITMAPEDGYQFSQNIRPILDFLRTDEEQPGLFRSRAYAGTVKLGMFKGVWRCQVTGGFMRLLRDFAQLGAFLSEVVPFRHSITRLDATADYGVDSPPLLTRFYRKGKGGGVRFTNHAIKPAQMRYIRRPRHDGVDSGTVYFGQQGNLFVFGKVYDKRHQVMCSGGDDMGPLTRVELTFTREVRCSLRDVQHPHELFFHHARHSLVVPPSGLRGWSPYGEGFVMEKREKLLPKLRLNRLAEADLNIGRMVDVGIGEGWTESEILAEIVASTARAVRMRLAAESGALLSDSTGQGMGAL
jgi:hypothetical protein